MLIYRYLSFLTLHTYLTLVHQVWGQISLNRLQNGEVIVHRHPEDPQPLYRLPTLIVPGSIEYETTVDGVVIKFSTAMELTRTASAKPTTSASRQRGTRTSHNHQIRPTKVHEGVIEVFSDSNIIIAFDDPDSMIPLPSLTIPIPSSISFPESSSASSAISHSESDSTTVSSFELLNFHHAATPVLPDFLSPSSPSPDHLYASFFPLPFEESPFEALRSKQKSSPNPSILPSSSSSSGSDEARVWKTLTSPSNPWHRLFGQQIHASASAAPFSPSSSISRSGHETSSSVPSSRDAQRVRMNRLKLKVKNTDKLYDICLKDVCLRGQLPQAVLLIGSQMPSPTPVTVTLTPSTRSKDSATESLDAKSSPVDDSDKSKELLYDIKGSKDETFEDEGSSGVKSITNYDFPLSNDWKEVQDLQTVENQRIRNQIKLNIDVPSFRSRNITSSEASLSASASPPLSSPSPSWSGVREARMKSGSHTLPALAFLSLPAPVAAAVDPESRTSHVSMKVAGSGDGSVSGYATAEALILAGPPMTTVRMDTQTLTGDAMTAAAGDQELRRYTSQQSRDPLLPIMSSASSILDPNPMDGFIPSGATPVLPQEAASLFHSYPSDQLRVGSLITLSQTFSRPMGSTSRITVWKHRMHLLDQPTNFTITESFFINQVITAFRTMPSAIMTHAVQDHDWEPKKMIKSSSTTPASAPMETTRGFPNDFPAFSLPPYVPMIDPSAFVMDDESSDHNHHLSEQSHAPAESRQIRVNLRQNALSRLRSSKVAPVLPVASVTVKTQLRSQVQTKILAIIYNPDSTKFKTITHTKYFSTRITMTRTSAPTADVPFTRSVRSG